MPCRLWLIHRFAMNVCLKARDSQANRQTLYRNWVSFGEADPTSLGCEMRSIKRLMLC